MNLSRFDLNLLVALDALLTERNVTRAGERVNISQPAMSGTLSRLRAAFGDELLVRVGRHLEPTPLAEDLAPILRKQLEDIEKLINYRRLFDPATEHRTFTVGASDYSAFLILPPLLSLIAKLAPGIKLRFSRLDGDTLNQLQGGDIDFVILPRAIEHGFPAEPLFEDEWVTVVWKDNPKVSTKMTEDLFLSLSHLSYQYDRLESMADMAVNKIGLNRKVVTSTESFVLAPFLIRGTELVTTLPLRAAVRLGIPAELRILECPYNIPNLQEEICWNPRLTNDPAFLWLREQIAHAVAVIDELSDFPSL